MQVVNRSAHTIDYRLGRRDRRRKIHNHANYETPAGLIVPSRSAVEYQPTKPPSWGAGVWDFSHAQLESPLQVHVRDSTDPSNRALLGINPTKRPDVWATWKVLNANSVEPVFSQDGKHVAFAGLWDGCNWGLDISPHMIKDTITIKDKSVAPTEFVWTLKIAPGCTLEPRADGIHLLDSDGVSHGFITYPIAWDDNGGSLDPNIRVSMSFGEPIGPYQTMVITPNPDDVAASVGDVVIDPTATISGTADIEDNLINSGSSGANYGSRTDFYIQGAGNTGLRTLVRAASSAFPAGTISDFRFYLYTNSGVVGDLIRIYLIEEANTWVEGTVNGAAQTGSSCWDWRVYNTQAWAGSAGCNTAGTDYVNVAYNGTAILSAYATIDLPDAWATDWRDGEFVNNGFLMRTVSSSATVFASTEAASNQPYFEVDYTAGPTGIPLFFMDRRN